MNVLDILTPDPNAMTPVHVITAAIRRALPQTATPRRDEVIGALSTAGHRLAFVGNQLHAVGVRVA